MPSPLRSNRWGSSHLHWSRCSAISSEYVCRFASSWSRSTTCKPESESSVRLRSEAQQKRVRSRFKNHVSTGGPGQHRYLESLGIDWSQRESHKLRDVAPTEVGRRFVSPVLSQERLGTVVSRQDSLYFVGRLEYCDVYGDCRYFMRCAELGNQPGVVTYCGTHVGSLDEYAGN